MSEVYLSISKIFEYLEATPTSRCFIEGEHVLNAKHVILCGIKNREVSRIEIFALCLQSSSIHNKPHEISGELIVEDSMVTSVCFKCTCKAGLAGKCKHVAATLLKCARYEFQITIMGSDSVVFIESISRSNIGDLETISSTDISCAWTGYKRKSDYLPSPISQSECISKRSSIQSEYSLSNEEKEECFQLLTSISMESAQSKHL